MKKSEEIRRDQELAEQARPRILEGLRNDEELLVIAERVAGELDVDGTKAYRWVAFIAEEYEAARRRVSSLGLVLLWAGVLVLVAGVVLSLLGVSGGGLALWLPGIIVGVPTASAGVIVLARRRKLAKVSR
jgi:hypothetical protein